MASSLSAFLNDVDFLAMQEVADGLRERRRRALLQPFAANAFARTYLAVAARPTAPLFLLFSLTQNT